MNYQKRLIDILPILAAVLSAVFLAFIPSYSTLEKNIFFSSSVYTICFVVLISLFSVYLLYELKYEKLQINKIFAGLFLYLILSNLIVSIVQPDTYTYQSITIRIGSEEKWFGICALASELVTLYYFIFIFPKKYNSLKVFTFFAILLLSFTMITVVYSYIAEWEMYKTFFELLFRTHDFGNMPEIHSFLNHHNIYAMFLMVGLFASFYLHARTNKHWMYIFIIFILINIIFTSSLGGILTTVLMIIGYTIIRLIKNYSMHKKIVIVISSLLGACLLLFVILSIISTSTGGSFLPKLNGLYNEIINGSTSQSRVKIWNNCILLLNQNIGWAFGRGFVIFQSMLYPMNVLNNDAVFSTHNSVLALIGYGGIPMLLIFAALVLRGFVIGIKNYKSNKQVVLTSLLCTAAFLLYTIIETNHIILLCFLYPMFLLNEENKKEVSVCKQEEKEIKQDSLIQRISLPILLVSIVLSGLCYPLIANYGVSYLFVPFAIFLGTVLIQLFVLIIIQKQKFSFKSFLSSTYINFIIELSFILLTILYMYIFKESGYSKGIVIGLAFALFTGLLYFAIPCLRINSGYNCLLSKIDYLCNKKLYQLVTFPSLKN